MDEWHFNRNGQSVGPLSFDALIVEAAQGRLAPSDLVWTSGLPDWRRADTIPALFPAGVPSPDLARAASTSRASQPVASPPPLSRTAADGGPEPASLIARNWRGELPLWQSFWLYYVLLSVVVNAAVSFFILLPLRGLDALWTAWVVLGLALFGIALTVWQLMGIWRSAGRYMLERGPGYVWPILARGVVLLAVALPTLAMLTLLATFLQAVLGG